MFRVILTSEKKNFCNTPGSNKYSIECGYSDNESHFDHHGEWSDHCSPCLAKVPNLQSANPDLNTVYISHIDADTFLTLAHMAGIEYPKINLQEIENYDLTKSFAKNSNNKTACFFSGICEVAKKLNFPQCDKDKDPDVTEIITKMFETPIETYIETGKEMFKKEKADYEKSKRAEMIISATPKNIKIGLWSLFENQSFRTTYPASVHGFDIAVVYRYAYETISIYSPNDSVFMFDGREYAGIKFQGHGHAAGSPRGFRQQEVNAKNVFFGVINKII